MPSDAFLSNQGLHKGSMRLIDEAEAVRLYEAMGPGREISGGSAGNTAAGLAALGLKAAFIGQVADDQLGKIYQHDIEAQGIDFLVPARSDVGATARSLILVTPDAQRTMNTFLGAAQQLERSRTDLAAVADSGIIYLEGYLWDPPAPRAAMAAAIEAAHAAGRKVAFTLSDTFCVERHREGFWQLLRNGKIDILFANEAEAASMAMVNDVEEAIACIAKQVPTLVVTRSEAGATAISEGERADVPAEPIERLVDTTGAGDLFAAGFLAGEARDLGLEASLQARRHRRGGGDPALWRAAGKGFESAGRRRARLIGQRALELDLIAGRVANIEGHAVALGAVADAFLDDGDPVTGKMGSHRLLAAWTGGDADMVHVAAAFGFGPCPFAFLGADVDQVDQRRPGAKLEHAIFGQRPIDRASQHLLVEALRLGHVADQQDNMVDAFKLERRTAHGPSLRLLAPTKKGGPAAGPAPLFLVSRTARAG